MSWRRLVPNFRGDESPREKFAARTKAEARTTALIIVYKLLESYFDGGPPYEDLEDGVPEKDVDRLHSELQKILTSLDLRIQRALEAELRKKDA